MLYIGYNAGKSLRTALAERPLLVLAPRVHPSIRMALILSLDPRPYPLVRGWGLHGVDRD